MSTTLSPRSSSASVHPTRQQLDELDALLQRMLELPVNTVAVEPAAPANPVGPTEEAPANNSSTVPAADSADEAWVPLRSSWQPSAQTWGPLARQWQEAQQAGQFPPKTSQTVDDAPAPTNAASAEAGPRMETLSASKLLALPMGRAAVPEQDAAPADKPRSAAALPTSWRVDAHANEPLEPLPALKSLVSPLVPALKPERRVELPPASADEPPLSILLWPFAAIDTAFDCCLMLLGPIGKPLRSRGGKSFLGFLGLMSLLAAAVLAAIDWFGWTW